MALTMAAPATVEVGPTCDSDPLDGDAGIARRTVIVDHHVGQVQQPSPVTLRRRSLGMGHADDGHDARPGGDGAPQPVSSHAALPPELEATISVSPGAEWQVVERGRR